MNKILILFIFGLFALHSGATLTERHLRYSKHSKHSKHHGGHSKRNHHHHRGHRSCDDDLPPTPPLDTPLEVNLDTTNSGDQFTVGAG